MVPAWRFAMARFLKLSNDRAINLDLIAYIKKAGEKWHVQFVGPHPRNATELLTIELHDADGRVVFDQVVTGQ